MAIQRIHDLELSATAKEILQKAWWRCEARGGTYTSAWIAALDLIESHDVGRWYRDELGSEASRDNPEWLKVVQALALVATAAYDNEGLDVLAPFARLIKPQRRQGYYYKLSDAFRERRITLPEFVQERLNIVTWS